jgi:hypothetical protein
MAKNGYLVRLDNVRTYFHYSMRKALGIGTTEKWYTHARTPKPLCEHEDVTLLLNQTE